jgi:hypothetical protein
MGAGHRNRQLALIDPVEAEFVEWIRANQPIVEACREIALEWYRNGNDKFSAKTLVEVVRWQHGIGHVDTDGSGFKINNNYTSRLARHIVQTTPELPSDFFQTRQLKSDLGETG